MTTAMTKDNEPVHSVEVEIAPEKSMNLLESFEYASNQLQNLRERMEQSDRKLYRSVGEFMDSTDRTIQNLAAEALNETIAPDRLLNPALGESSVESSVKSSSNEVQKLQERHQSLRSEINSLLLTAYTNEEIDRLRNLDYLSELIQTRIQELSTAPDSIASPQKVTVDELKSKFSSFNLAKEAYKIKASSWQTLVDKLNAGS